jgi:Trypsin-like peptidase domain
LSTNAHVVGDASRVELLWEKKKEEARVIYRDVGSDLAILVLEGPPLPTRPPMGGRMNVPEVGETVYSVGAPLGLQRTLSEGIISGLRLMGTTPTIQTTAAISPGSSGGGLFDTQGRFIGVPTYKLVRGEALNFALDAGMVQDVDHALWVRNFIARDMREQGEEFSPSYGGDAFIRWLSELIPDSAAPGRLKRRSSDYWTANEDANKKGDPQILVASIRSMQREFEQSASVGMSGETYSQSPVLRLTCRYAMVRYNPTVRTVTYTVDLQRKTVDGFPAEIGESRFVWIRRNEDESFTMIIDRATGEFVVNTPQFTPFMQGSCSKAGDNRF